MSPRQHCRQRHSLLVLPGGRMVLEECVDLSSFQVGYCHLVEVEINDRYLLHRTGFSLGYHWQHLFHRRWSRKQIIIRFAFPFFTLCNEKCYRDFSIFIDFEGYIFLVFYFYTKWRNNQIQIFLRKQFLWNWKILSIFL